MEGPRLEDRRMGDDRSKMPPHEQKVLAGVEKVLAELCWGYFAWSILTFQG